MANMPRFVATSAGSISAYSAAVAGLAKELDIRQCVGGLSFNMLSPMAGSGRIKLYGTCRLDRQPGPANHSATNLQVQVNVEAGVRPGQGTTVRQVLIPATCFEVANHPGPARSHLQRELLNLVRSTLMKSGGTAYVIDVRL